MYRCQGKAAVDSGLTRETPHSFIPLKLQCYITFVNDLLNFFVVVESAKPLPRSSQFNSKFEETVESLCQQESIIISYSGHACMHTATHRRVTSFTEVHKVSIAHGSFMSNSNSVDRCLPYFHC